MAPNTIASTDLPEVTLSKYPETSNKELKQSLSGNVSKSDCDRHVNPSYSANKITKSLIFCVLAAASAGLIFGYDIGITGGVTSNDGFLKLFFPDIYIEHQSPISNPWCKYDDPLLQLFTSSMFIAGMVSAIPAIKINNALGRRPTMIMGGLIFIIGAILMSSAYALPQLVIGRVCLGFGIGLGNQSVNVYLSEMPPPLYRGTLQILFQLATTIGIVVAQIINYLTEEVEDGWRISLALAAVPGLTFTLGAVFCSESPNSLMERGRNDEAIAVLKKIRDSDDAGIANELVDIQQAAENSKQSNWKALFAYKYRPQLIFAIFMPMFQQLTGINSVMFYAPEIFGSFGSGRSWTLIQVIIIGAVNVIATVFAVYIIDKVGRRKMLLIGGAIMFTCISAFGVLLAICFSTSDTLTTPQAAGGLVLVCLFVTGFAMSWGPLGWSVPSEVTPLECRSSGYGVTVSVNFLFSALIGQVFLSMLCKMQFGVFFFFAGFIFIMSTFIYFLLPETRGVPLEEVELLFIEHKLWKKFAKSDSSGKTVIVGGGGMETYVVSNV